ncbi:fimbria/pilus periplasmic chaperone [Rahnella bruchi]|uniref:fimbrial biogenesis chaperone n=1 Tax=Rahnella bruchi TaxID=1510573 RepID=UPI000EA3AD76|nr:fimbria/pilus periplasmic chaperone [Rahnella bruchi]
MRKIFLAGLIILLASPVVNAGVVIGGTRVIYGGKQKSVALTLRNNSDSPWLIKSRITPGGSWSGASVRPALNPFIITPPLFVIKAGRESEIRVIKSAEKLPDDRESLFTLSVATIPSGKTDNNNVQIAIRSKLKLLYRPARLKGVAAEAYKELHWYRSGNRLKVDNPTPYFVTLFDLQINGRKIKNAGVVPPYSIRETSWCHRQATQCHITWKSINDYGGLTPTARAHIEN